MFVLFRLYDKILLVEFGNMNGVNMKRGKIKLIIFLCILVVFFVIRLYIDHNVISKAHYEITSEKIPSAFDGFKILQISDLHSKDFKGALEKKINEENPDIVVMTGDMVSANQTDYSVFLNLTKTLSKKYEMYYIKGNHEGELSKKNYRVVKDALESYGIKILDNEMVTINKSGESINLYGMWCNQRYYSRAHSDKDYVIKEATLEKLLGVPNKDEYNLLLMHTPVYFNEYSNWGADLVLARSCSWRTCIYSVCRWSFLTR